jgi:hypothetical protein
LCAPAQASSAPDVVSVKDHDKKGKKENKDKKDKEEGAKEMWTKGFNNIIGFLKIRVYIHMQAWPP